MSSREYAPRAASGAEVRTDREKWAYGRIVCPEAMKFEGWQRLNGPSGPRT
jgi:hypothetical protein